MMGNTVIPRPHPHLGSRPTGFTLIEIMLAIGILGFVIVMVYGVFARSLSAKEHTEARAAETASARAVLNRIIRDLQSARPQGSSPVPQPTPSQERTGLAKATQQYLFLSTNRTDAGVPFDDLAFSAIVRRPTAVTLSTADLAVIRYFVESDPADPQRHVLFRETLFSLSGEVFDPEAPDPGNTVRIFDGVAGLEFLFFNGQEWVQEWDSSDRRNFGPAPRAVEIALAITGEDGTAEVFRTAVDLQGARISVPGGAGGKGGDDDDDDDDDEQRRSADDDDDDDF